MVVLRLRRGGRRLTTATVLAVLLTQASTRPAVALKVGATAIPGVAAAIMVDRTASEADTTPVRPGELPPISDTEWQSYGCLAGGTVATLLASLAGARQTSMIVGGSAIAPSNPIVLWTVLAGTLVAAVCAATALVTPTAVHLWNHFAGEPPQTP